MATTASTSPGRPRPAVSTKSIFGGEQLAAGHPLDRLANALDIGREGKAERGAKQVPITPTLARSKRTPASPNSLAPMVRRMAMPDPYP